MSTHRLHLGALTLDGSGTRFTVWAPNHEHLKVCFVQDGRAEPMVRTAAGYHVIETDAPAGTLYQYQFADGRLRPDPASRAQPTGVHGPSMVIERAPRHAPSLEPFLNPALAEHIIYELHVGTFTPEGTFDAIIPCLPELKNMGITAIELMPIAQFPGERNWGYDGVYPFAAQWSYGGPSGLGRLVSACHEQGLAIILDVVYNHLGPEGNYLQEFGPYFTDRYKTPWGPALNFDGPHADHVREFFIQSSLHWTAGMGIDGLRLDAVHAIVDHSARTFVQELTERNHGEADRQGRRVLIIAESCDNDPRLVRPVPLGGYGMNGCWNDDYHHAIRAALTGERRGYYRSFGDPALVAKAIRDRYVFAGEYSSAYQRRHGAPARDVPHGRLVVFTQNHDQVGNRARGDRLHHAAGLDGARLAAALVLLGPFTPMVWMGEEYAEDAPFQYFVSHSDPELVEAVRRGRAAEFAEFHEEGDVPDPQDPATFERSKLRWRERTEGVHPAMLRYYAELFRLRTRLDIPGRAEAVLSRTHGDVVYVQYPGVPAVWVVANFGAKRAEVRLEDDLFKPVERMLILLDSSDVRWGGDHEAMPRGAHVTGKHFIHPKSALVVRAVEEQR